MEELTILYEFIFGNVHGVTMAPLPLLAGIAIGGKLLGGIAQGIFGRSRAKRQQRRFAADRRKATAALVSIEKNRQKVINPYENVSDLSSLAKDLTGNMSNPMASLSVSTAGAEMQAEQADISLANTLDTLRATGAGAGGATALAQAALQSKKGVAASIEGQEAANEKMRAQGEQQLQTRQNNEQVRLQDTQISEGKRTQKADILGKTFKFEKQEARDNDKIADLRKLRDTAKAREIGAYNARTRMGSVVGGLARGIGSAASSAMDAGADFGDISGT
tara:strand:- start:28 stop:858 length:831 start_codon:yes stop_codon:yes gene_type:complete